MIARTRRAAAAALVAALVAGVAAAWLIGDYAKSIEQRDGAPVTVLVAAAPLKRGESLDLDALETAVASRRVPQSFASADAVASIEELAGLRPLLDLPAGTQLTAALFTSTEAATGFRLRRGERAVTIGAVIAPDGAEPSPGSMVDVFAAGIGGGTGVEAVIAGAEVLVFSESEHSAAEIDRDSAAARRGAAFRLTLRVTSAQAAAVIRADAFAEDLRAVLR